MKAKNILFATDFSENSEAARHLATSLARDTGARLSIVHVVEPPPRSADRGRSPDWFPWQRRPPGSTAVRRATALR